MAYQFPDFWSFTSVPLLIILICYIFLLESIESRDPEMYEVPPMLPSKKGSIVEEPDIPPPLPLKKATNPSTDFSLSGGNNDSTF